MPKSDLSYLEHIFERANKIISFTDGMTEDDFLKDEKTQSAVIRELEVIGEASKRISDEFKNNNNAIPWKLMSGMRDVLIHDYEGVDKFSVPSLSSVKLELFDVAGKKVETLVEGMREVGEYSVGVNNSGYSTGMYFYRLQVGNTIETKKIIIQ